MNTGEEAIKQLGKYTIHRYMQVTGLSLIEAMNTMARIWNVAADIAEQVGDLEYAAHLRTMLKICD